MVRSKSRPRRGHGGGAPCWHLWGEDCIRNCEGCRREDAVQKGKGRTLRISGEAAQTRNGRFIHFPGLPVEIQSQIWGIVASEPRFIITGLSRKTNGLISLSPLPALLYTCRLSREIALTIYTLALGNPIKEHSPQIYFNFDKDGIYFPKSTNDMAQSGSYVHTMSNVISKEERNMLRFAAVALGDDMTKHTTEYLLLEDHIFPGLEQVYLSMEAPRLDVHRGVVLKPLEKKDHWAFERDARRIFGNYLVPKELSSVEALEACRRAACEPFGSAKSPGDIGYEWREKRSKDVSLVTASNL